MAFLVVALFATALIPMDEAVYYVLYKQPKKWDFAYRYCKRSVSGQLASWSSDAEWNRIVELHKESGSHIATWVGLHDRDDWWSGVGEGDWRFIFGDNCGGNCDNLDQWAPGEPNDHGWWTGGEDCAAVWTGMGNKLNDADCDNEYWFVCEYDGRDEGDDKVADTIPFVPQLPHPDEPVNNVPGTQFVFDFASGQQGVVIVALAASTVIWMAIAVYYCCQYRQQKGKESYSKVVQFSEDERLNAL